MSSPGTRVEGFVKGFRGSTTLVDDSSSAIDQMRSVYNNRGVKKVLSRNRSSSA